MLLWLAQYFQPELGPLRVFGFITSLSKIKKPSIGKLKALLLWALLESNQPPTDYESVALTE